MKTGTVFAAVLCVLFVAVMSAGCAAPNAQPSAISPMRARIWTASQNSKRFNN